MRRISVDRVNGIRKSGGAVFGEGGTHYEPKPERVETKPDPVTPDDIKNGFAAGADDGHAAARHFLQIGGNIHGKLTAACNAADTAGRHKADS